MGANADPSGSGGGGASLSRNNGGATSLSTPGQGLRHNPGISLTWMPEEQAILEELNIKFASESTLVRYARIAMELKDKTARDVAFRCRWMSKKENGKRRKDDHNLSRKNKDKKERAMDATTKPSTNVGPRPNPYALPMLPVDDDGISFKEIGGRTGQLLENNADAFNKISANLAGFKIQENINLFCQTRDNILAILKDLTDNIPEYMKLMPPLPVKINEEVANSILPITNVRTQT